MADRLSWQVERVVTDQTINTAAGDTIVVNYVYFVTGDGNHGVIYCPTDTFNKAHVAKLIRPAARELDDVAALAENFS
jgi:hypothetical protein